MFNLLMKLVVLHFFVLGFVNTAGAMSRSTGPQKVMVILLEPEVQAKYQLYPPGMAHGRAALHDMFKYVFQGELMGSADGKSINQHLKTSSRGKTWIEELKIVGPFESPKEKQLLAGLEIRCTEYADILPKALQSARVLYGDDVLNRYDHFIVASPCEDAVYTSTDSERAQAWVEELTKQKIDSFDAGVVTLANISLQVHFPGNLHNLRHSLLHEMGHSMGLKHGSGIYCDGKVLPGISDSPKTAHYQNPYSPMGGTGYALFNFPQLMRLNWRDASEMEYVDRTDDFVLKPLGSDEPGLKALKIRRGHHTNSFIWLEYRRPVTNFEGSLFKNHALSKGHVPVADEEYRFQRDAAGAIKLREWAGYGWLDPEARGGLLLYEYGNYDHRDDIYVLDATPGTAKRFDAKWGDVSDDFKDGLLTKDFTDPETGLTIKITDATDEGLHVSVVYPEETRKDTLKLWSPLMISVSGGKFGNPWHLERYAYAHEARKLEVRKSKATPLENVKLKVQVFDPAGALVHGSEGVTDAQGRWELPVIKLGAASPSGEYKFVLESPADDAARSVLVQKWDRPAGDPPSEEVAKATQSPADPTPKPALEGPTVVKPKPKKDEKPTSLGGWFSKWKKTLTDEKEPAVKNEEEKKKEPEAPAVPEPKKEAEAPPVPKKTEPEVTPEPEAKKEPEVRKTPEPKPEEKKETTVKKVKSFFGGWMKKITE